MAQATSLTYVHSTLLSNYIAIPGPPASLTATNVEATAFTLSWSQPAQVVIAIEAFELSCTNNDGYGPWADSVSGSTTNIRRTGVEEYTVYTCCVAAVSSGVEGEQRCVDVTTDQAGRFLLLNSHNY